MLELAEEGDGAEEALLGGAGLLCAAGEAASRRWALSNAARMACAPACAAADWCAPDVPAVPLPGLDAPDGAAPAAGECGDAAAAGELPAGGAAAAARLRDACPTSPALLPLPCAAVSICCCSWDTAASACGRLMWPAAI